MSTSEPAPIELIEPDLVYANRWIKVWFDRVRFPGGGEGRYTRIEVGENDSAGAIVVARDEAGRTAFVRSYRYPAGRWMVELPRGGALAGEEPVATALRELREEAGIVAATGRLIGEAHPDSGILARAGGVVLASGLSSAASAVEAEEVIGGVIWLDAGAYRRELATGGITDALSIAAMAQVDAVLALEAAA